MGASPRVVDWNHDGKKDLVVGQSYTNGRVRIYLNTNNDTNPVFNGYSYLQVGGTDFTVANQATPEIVDWNNDGKKDVLCGGIWGDVYLMTNSGTDASPVFNQATPIQNGASSLNVGTRSSPVVVDWNGDGNKDLLVGCEAGTVYYFENKGTDANPSFNGATYLAVDGVQINVGGFSRLDVTDWNGDGRLDLLVGNISGNVYYFETLDPALPHLTLKDVFVNDAAGNTNGSLNAGETASIFVRLANSSARAEGVTATLTCTNPAITILSGQASFGSIENGLSVRNSLAPFGVRVATNATGAFYTFDLLVSYAGTSSTSRQTFVVGNYAINTNTSWTWIDMSSAQNLYLGDETYTHVLNMGFAFPFYGRSWSDVYIYGNGYINFGVPQGDYDNVDIPGATAPDAFIAPFWDDLDPSVTGSVRMASLGAAPNRSFVVSWEKVPRYYDGGELSFQVILYESGKIKFQYGPVTGENADGASATIGIENHEGTGGVLVGFNRAGTVWNGRAIEFNTSGPAPDSDSDGMPDAFEAFYFGDAMLMPSTTDSDSDGISNLDELRIGTDPMDGGSVLHLTGADQPQAGQAVLAWAASPGVGYRLQARTNLMAGAWTNVATSLVYAAGSSCSVTTAPGPTPHAFYRVIAR